MTKTLKLGVLCITICFLTTFLCPRFGWRMVNQYPQDKTFGFAGTVQDERGKTVTYASQEGDKVQISYPNRFIRLLTVQFDDRPAVTMRVKIDTGITEQAPTNIIQVNDMLGEIIWADSSGAFYVYYLIPMGIMLLLLYVFTKTGYYKTKFLTQKQAVISSYAIFIVLSVLLSARLFY